MEDEKKFSVKVVAIVDEFKSKMESIKDLGQRTANNIKQAFLGNKVDIGTTDAVIRISELKRQISSLKTEMRDITPGTSAFREYASAIDKAEKELKELVQAQKQAKTNGSSMVSGLNTGLNKTGNMFSKLTHSVIRYGLALFSIRSIFSLVSRASSAYLSQDTELANKLQSAWAGLGAFLAPLLEKIANIVIKLVGYLNIFIKAVTGQDLLAKASKKATDNIKKQTGAVKGLNKALTSMDEITNIQDETSGAGGIGGADIENPFDNFKDVELPWADKIRKFGEWFKENWPSILAGLTGLLLILSGLKMWTPGNGLPLLGRILIGLGVTILGVIVTIQNLKKYLDDINKGLDNTEKGWKDFGKTLAGVGITVLGIGIIFGAWPIAVAGAMIALFGVLTSYWPKITKFLNDNMEKLRTFLSEKLGVFGETVFEAVDGIVSSIWELLDSSIRPIKQGVTGILKIFKGDLAGGLKSIGKGIVNHLISVLNIAINAINTFLIPLRSIIVMIGKAMGKNISMGDVKLPRIPKLDTGTGYVPQDQVAMIHKGEAVIPKKFNSAEYFSNINNNEETNALLIELNKTLLEVRDKDTTLRVNGKELARTTYNDFKNEGNRLGQTSIVEVR